MASKRKRKTPWKLNDYETTINRSELHNLGRQNREKLKRIQEQKFKDDLKVKSAPVRIEQKERGTYIELSIFYSFLILFT